MNPRVKALWLERLRSGQYQQGRVNLRNADDEFCCLGILCEIAVEEGVIPAPSLSPEDSPVYRYGNRGRITSLPDEVSEWSGVARWGGLFNTVRINSYSYDNLAHMNDDGIPFAKIADVIEKEL